MTETPEALSPVHELLAARGAHWGQLADVVLALHFGDPTAETIAARDLALCDVSALPKLGVRGKDASSWLEAQGVEVPLDIYATARLDTDGVVARLGSKEFLLEDGLRGRRVPDLSRQLGAAQGEAYRIERQDATFLLSGARALEVVVQVCGVDFRKLEPGRIVYTRFAGVSVAVLPSYESVALYRIWSDYTFGAYLWEELAQICSELKGQIVGVDSLQ